MPSRRGGARPGGGRKATGETGVRVAFYLPRDIAEWVKAQRNSSKIAASALRRAMKEQRDED